MMIIVSQSLTRYGTTATQFAKVAEKNHRHSVNNPNAQFQDEYTLDQILASKEICPPLTVRHFVCERRGLSGPSSYTLS